MYNIVNIVFDKPYDAYNIDDNIAEILFNEDGSIIQLWRINLLH